MFEKIKLDLEKVYVHLDWDFVKKCFTCLGFSDRWIGWIIQGISVAISNILVNVNIVN